MEITKREAESIRKGSIPNAVVIGNPISEFRQTEENEVFLCCVIIGDDSQSGTLYCGEIAEYVAFVPCETKDGEIQGIGAIGLCGKRSHTPSRYKLPKF